MHRQLLMAAALLAAFSEARAQDPFGPRPGVTITPFEFGTAASYGTHSAGRSRYPGPYVYPDAELAAQLIEVIGTGLADLVGERLVESERFRVYERRQLEAVQREQELDRGDDDSIARARYLITGSISLLGNDDQDITGIVAGAAAGTLGLGRGLSALFANTSRTMMRVTVRVVDTHSGEVIGGFTSEGRSRKRWGGTLASIGAGGVKVVGVNNRNFRETAIGEAADRAASDIAERLIAMRAERLRP